MAGLRGRGMLVVGLALALLGAQQTGSCGQPGRVYGLTADSSFQVGCFPPLLCPVAIADALGGTLRLVRIPQEEPALFDAFAVSDVYWLVRIGGEDIPITGWGVYRIGGELALQQRLILKLRVGDEEAQVFDSGLVMAEGEFPNLDITISINGQQGFDTVIDVRAIPFPRPRPTTPTPCGPSGLTCDPTQQICVSKTPVGPAVTYSCEPIPAGCEEDRSCVCAGPALCTSPFTLCTDIAPNSLQCECPECQ